MNKYQTVLENIKGLNEEQTEKFSRRFHADRADMDPEDDYSKIDRIISSMAEAENISEELLYIESGVLETKAFDYSGVSGPEREKVQL